MKRITIISSIIFLAFCSYKSSTEKHIYFSPQMKSLKKENVWVFIMAGQSNMAGRGVVEPEDTIPDKRVLSINRNGEIIIAKEPLHFYEPERTGLDCGLSFAKALITKIPDSVSVLIIPTAVGGSSIRQWLGDSAFRNVKLFSNFVSKVEIAKRNGVIKGILWHQGESDANEINIPLHKQRLHLLFSKFRIVVGNNELPILLGELGSFSGNRDNFNLINKSIHEFAAEDKNSSVILTGDLKDKGDQLHFNSEGLRTMGKRFAEAWLKKFNR